MRREAAEGDAPAPAARFEKLVVTETSDEVLIYDTEKHHIHHLNATTAAVWRLCDGTHTVVDLARGAGQALGAPIDEATVRLALTKLDDARLLKESLVDALRMSRISRRTFLQRAGAAGAIVVPAIVSVTAPAAALFSEDSCKKPCSKQKDCKVGCLVCKFFLCEPDQCGNPCENDDPCERASAGDCKVCTGPVGVKTCQESHESVVAGAESSAVFESVEAPLDGVDPPPGGTPVGEASGG